MNIENDNSTKNKGYASNKKSPRASGGSPRADAFKKK